MTKKGRPKKVRYIQRMPKIVQFSPRGRPGRPEEVELMLDQFEAIKLADYQGFDQGQGAMAMSVSRASFGRILRDGRRILADAIVNGKIIKIRMGDVQVGVTRKDLRVDTINEALKEFQLRNERILDEAQEVRNRAQDNKDTTYQAAGGNS